MGFSLEVAPDGRRAHDEYQRPRIWCAFGFTTAYPSRLKFRLVEVPLLVIPEEEAVRKSEIPVIPGLGRRPRARNP